MRCGHREGAVRNEEIFAIAVMGVIGAFVVLMVARSVGKLRKARMQMKAIHAERLRLARICPECGYDVRAASKPDASGRCPECGATVFPPEI